jgi:hypothetical protein
MNGGIITQMTILRVLLMVVSACAGATVMAQAPAADTSGVGPQVGAVVPAFSGTDQFGRTHTLSSVYGPKGVMLVFFRSADW